ncbi:MAG: hypothetical protein R2828_24870 [Saprospiraceae bacterium]
MIITHILKTLSTRERTKFQEYVHAPFFNKNEKIKQLCQSILNHAPDFNPALIDKVKLYKQIYGKEAYQELRLNNLISDLLQLLYDYLAYIQYEKQPSWQKSLLLEELQDRGLHQQIQRQANRYRQLQQNAPYRSHAYFLDEYRLYEELDRLSLSVGKRGYDKNLQLKSDVLDTFYCCNKLSIACDMTSRNIVVNAGYECHFLDEILAQFQAKPSLQEQPAIQIYYKTLQMLLETDQADHYFGLKDLLAQHWKIFPPRELRILYHYALNYSVKKINSGQNQFYQEILDLYKILLSKKIIFKDGYLTQWTYINIVTAGIRLKDYNWTENFIKTYKESLHPDDQHNVFTYNLAALYYAQRDYKSALQLLHDVEFTDAFYHLSAKIIQLKSYYDLEETEAFFSLTEATRLYLTRNRQLSDYQKRSNANFLKIATRLLQIRLRKPLLPAQEIQRQCHQLQLQLDSKTIANKSWLQEAFKELESGR